MYAALLTWPNDGLIFYSDHPLRINEHICEIQYFINVFIYVGSDREEFNELPIDTNRLHLIWWREMFFFKWFFFQQSYFVRHHYNCQVKHAYIWKLNPDNLSVTFWTNTGVNFSHRHHEIKTPRAPKSTIISIYRLMNTA